jgi:tetratricopeptide (TPR) repeat protein
MEKDYDIFISFKNSGRDRELAYKLYKFLKSKNLKIFFSEATLEELGADSWGEEIEDALRASKIFIALATEEEHFYSYWLQRERTTFLTLKRDDKSKAIYSYIAPPMTTQNLPDDIRGFECFEDTKADEFERLYSFISNHLSHKNTTLTAKKRREIKYLLSLIIGTMLLVPLGNSIYDILKTPLPNKPKEIIIKENNITNSTIIVFNGKKFDLTKSGFFDYIKNYPTIEKNLINYFGKRLDKVDRTNSEILTMVKKLANNQDTTQLQSKLDIALKEKRELEALIEKLKREQNDFKPILDKAEEYLDNHQYSKYHEILQEFRKKSREKREESRKFEAQSAYLEAKEYYSRLEYKKAKELYGEAVEIEPKNEVYLSAFSSFLWEYGDYPNALKYAKKALAIREILFKKENPTHPDLIASYGNIAMIYRDMNNSEMFKKYGLMYLKGREGSE